MDNTQTIHFPPIFSQDGGSCGSASNEAYALTHELNSLRDKDGSLPENQLPSHFVFMHAYQPSERHHILLKNGVPNVVDYGGRTYSKLLGNQDCKDEDNGRMQGYDKWYRAMFNRATRNVGFTADLMTEVGREELKNWLWNHNGDPDFHSGGVACVGCAITNCQMAPIPSTYRNKQIGTAGKQYLTTWGPTYDHSVTIVGYDDRIQFDLNGDSYYGDKKEDELGAWIICNSWGDGWANGGCVYLPYKYGYSVGRDIMPMTPSCWIVRKHYEPKRTLRIEMEYSHRGDLQLLAGVSTQPDATVPEQTTTISCFNFDGNPNWTTPAPATPMLGRWADGKMHTAPMEFGFDVTDLTARVDDAHELPYFLQVHTADGAVGTGKVHRLSLIDYENGETVTEALEYGVETVDIRGAGTQTFISVKVPGRGTFAPVEPKFTKSSMTLSWKAPQTSAYELKEYVVYQADKEVATLASDQLSYVAESGNQGYLQVAARYVTPEGNTLESRRTEAICPVITNFSPSADLDCELDGRYLAILRDKIMNAKLTGLDLGDATIIQSDYEYAEGSMTLDYEMGYNLFRDCKRLKHVIIPRNTKLMSEGVFYGCSGLTKAEVPDEVITIGRDVFCYCDGLKTVTIGSKVTTLGRGVFWSAGLQHAYVKPLTPPSLGVYCFTSRPVFHVYPEAVEAYKNSGWADYGSIVGDLDNYIPRDETGVNSVLKPAETHAPIYTLDGIRRNDAPQQGFYIRDGRKFWKK